MNEWNIQSRSHGCQACHAHFVDTQPYHTILFDEKQEFKRLDVCETCWKSQYSEGANDRKGFISHWQGVYHAPPTAAPDPIQKENAETLLRKLIELNDPQHIAATYILAVMLERKRILKVKEQIQRPEGRIFVYEQPKTGDIFTIPDPNLQLNQLQQVQHDVANLLEHGLTPAAETASPAVVAGPVAEGSFDVAESAGSPPAASEPLVR
ncbi:MAG TPA: hypothetical protein VMZ27_05965 [Candidatus Saccharimonadales bacterium]|nr:hypothetical protein [Candidatus Saccharimonadales bacterium]